MLNSLHDIVYTAKQKGVKKLVVPCPGENDLSLLAEASVSGLIVPYFVGDEVTIKKITLSGLLGNLIHQKVI